MAALVTCMRKLLLIVNAIIKKIGSGNKPPLEIQDFRYVAD